jgi:uncharacterized protein (TIGR02246 family)
LAANCIGGELKMLSLKLLAALILIAAPDAAAAAAPDDVSAIRQVQVAQQAAWNAHDARAYSRLFTPDADTVNVLGWWWKSRAEMEQQLTAAFAFVFAKSVLHIESVTVRPLARDVALAHVTWSMTGAASPNGSGANIPEHGVQTQVLRKVGGRWMIRGFQNTNSLPVRPFPTGIPARP